MLILGVYGLAGVTPALAQTSHPEPGPEKAPASAPDGSAALGTEAGAPARSPAASAPASEAPGPADAAATPAGAPASAPAAPDAAATPAPALAGQARARKDDRMRRLGIGGGLILGKAYMLTITVATGALALCWADPHGSGCLLPETRAAWYDLYIPVAGPFVSLRHQEVRDHLLYALSFAALGTAQSVGLVLVSAGLLTWGDDDAGASFTLVPEVASGERSLSLVGRF